MNAGVANDEDENSVAVQQVSCILAGGQASRRPQPQQVREGHYLDNATMPRQLDALV
jgi:hypothetical protein